MVKRWDVSPVESFDSMFEDATSFSQTLCWNFIDQAEADDMFKGTSGANDRCGRLTSGASVGRMCKNKLHLVLSLCSTFYLITLFLPTFLVTRNN
jgi:hypothetical protein